MNIIKTHFDNIFLLLNLSGLSSEGHSFYYHNKLGIKTSSYSNLETCLKTGLVVIKMARF